LVTRKKGNVRMAKKGGSPKKQATGKGHAKKSESRKPETSQAKIKPARSRTGSRQAKGSSQPSSQRSSKKALKNEGCLLPAVSILVILILLAVSIL